MHLCAHACIKTDGGLRALAARAGRRTLLGGRSGEVGRLLASCGTNIKIRGFYRCLEAVLKKSTFGRRIAAIVQAHGPGAASGLRVARRVAGECFAVHTGNPGDSCGVDGNDATCASDRNNDCAGLASDVIGVQCINLGAWPLCPRRAHGRRAACVTMVVKEGEDDTRVRGRCARCASKIARLGVAPGRSPGCLLEVPQRQHVDAADCLRGKSW